MADRVLRDHTQPCKHAGDMVGGLDQNYYEGHIIIDGDGPGLWCPGGREVTIDYEAAGRYLSTLIYDSDPDSTTHNEFLEYAMQEGHRIIDAALPDLEV